MRILALEPYYGGSHQAFLDQWIQRSEHQWELLTLPAHHWKWRMRHSGMWFARKVRERQLAGATWDAIFVSDMLDLAQFKGLVEQPLQPCVLYFHENQLTYPDRFGQERDLHFALTNFTSSLAAEQVWFNSSFHRQTLFLALRKWLGKMPDCQPDQELEQAEERSSVQSPGIDVLGFVRTPGKGPLHIAWAARWEHDKNPEVFFSSLRMLKQRGVDFQLTICGQSFRNVPAAFIAAKQEFAAHIRHWGYVGSRRHYLQTLAQCDVIVSTAKHEFFGLAVLECIALGLYPMLPERLSYPELLQLHHNSDARKYFYDGSAQHLAERLGALAQQAPQLRQQPLASCLSQAAERYSWRRRAAEMDRAME